MYHLPIIHYVTDGWTDDSIMPTADYTTGTVHYIILHNYLHNKPITIKIIITYYKSLKRIKEK